MPSERRSNLHHPCCRTDPLIPDIEQKEWQGNLISVAVVRAETSRYPHCKAVAEESTVGQRKAIVAMRTAYQ